MAPVLQEVLAANEAYAASFGDKGKLTMPPARYRNMDGDFGLMCFHGTGDLHPLLGRWALQLIEDQLTMLPNLWRLPSSAWSVDFATSKRRHCRLAPLLGQQGNLDRTYKPTAHLAARLGVSHMT